MPDQIEYFVYCDESRKTGEYFSNFYGGLIVAAGDKDEVEARIRAILAERSLTGELKWQYITKFYADQYIAVMNVLFDLLMEGRIRIRIMFTQNHLKAANLSESQVADSFEILYYQFIKHAFGFRYARPIEKHKKVRIYLDKLPVTTEKKTRFRAYIAALTNSAEFRHASVSIRMDDITDVDSHEHILIQCLDVVLGSMQFKLNAWDERKPEGASRRGSKTLAKQKVYKAINKRIRELKPSFNIGITTGHPNGLSDRWEMPYRHWVFVPKSKEILDVPSKNDKRKRRAP